MNANSPRSVPFYIEPNCSDCGTPLKLHDLHTDPDTPENEIWYDEFCCPVCNDGIIMDWPKDQLDALSAEMDEMLGDEDSGLVPVDDADIGLSADELREILGLDDDVEILVAPSAMPNRTKTRGDC